MKLDPKDYIVIMQALEAFELQYGAFAQKVVMIQEAKQAVETIGTY